MNKPRILVIEDDVSIRESIVSYLSENFDCFEAKDGPSGLRITQSVKVDLVVCDYLMPRMNGQEFFEQLPDTYDNVPKILITGDLTEIESLPEGVKIVHKPFDMDEILDVISTCLLEGYNKG